jgi:hypothetical protein
MCCGKHGHQREAGFIRGTCELKLDTKKSAISRIRKIMQRISTLYSGKVGPHALGNVVHIPPPPPPGWKCALKIGETKGKNTFTDKSTQRKKVLGHGYYHR